MNHMSKKQILIDCLLVTALVLTVYIAVISVIMLLQYQTLSATAPHEFEQLEELKLQARSEQDNEELKERIRKLDAMSRQGWFSGLEKLHQGRRLLGFGALLLIACILTINLIKPKEHLQFLEKSHRNCPQTDFLALLSVAVVSILLVNGFYLISSSVTEKAVETPQPQEFAEISTQEFEQNWPSFRGPYGIGISQNHRPITGWSDNTDQGIKWKTTIDLPGFSSPIVWDNHLFITGGDEAVRMLYAYDADTGDLIWQHEAVGIAGSPAVAPPTTDDTGYAASTPATDGNRVFAVFATGDLICTDFEGNRLWARNLGVPENMYGYSSSLLAVKNKLIVQYDNDDRQVLFWIDTETGEITREVVRETMVSWSSPAYCKTDDTELIVILTCMEVEAYNFETGEKEWVHPIMGGEVAPSATFADGVVYVANENACAAAIDASTGELLWQNYMAIFPDVSSPVVYEDMLFLFTSAATIGCLDTSTGDILWEEEVNEGFYSSPLLLSGVIKAFNKNGDMLVIEPDRDKLIIAAIESLKEDVLTTPAIVGSRMWIRGNRHLYSLQQGGEN